MRATIDAMLKRRAAIRAMFAVATLATFVTACGGGGGGGTSGTGTTAQTSGIAQVQIMDAPGLEFDHVYVTVKEIWFHRRDDASSDDGGWVKFAVPGGAKTIDLAALSHGITDVTSGNPVFGDLTLPTGDYGQIRLFLASTTGALESSAAALGLTRNNEVRYNGTAHVPLHVAGWDDGLALVGTFTVSATQPMRIAVDFDLSHDIVKFLVGSTPEFILKPRMRYYDLARAGAIVGRVDPGGMQSAGNPGGGYNFVVKVEELSADGTHHVATRYTTVKPDGSFVLYPLAANADGTQRKVDVLVRARGIETTIVKDVPVVANTTPSSNPTDLGPAIPLVASAEFAADPLPVNPTGSWINFYQTLTGTGRAEVPYEIRFRHVNPYTGRFTDAIDLSRGNLRWGVYANGAAIAFATVAPVEGAGSFKAVADAPFYSRTTPVTVSAGAPGVTQAFTVPALATVGGVASDDIGFNLVVPPILQGLLDRGVMLATRDGMIVDAVNVDALLAANGGTGTIDALPGGPSGLIKRPFYRLFGLAGASGSPWARAAGASPIVNLRSGSVSGVTVTVR